MRSRAARTSAATQAFVAILAAVVLGAIAITAYLVSDAQADARREAHAAAHSVALTFADSPATRDALLGDDATGALQPITSQIVDDTEIDFITVMWPDGTRITHPIPERIGDHYSGTIPATPQVFSEEAVGELGPSVRTIAPIMNGDDIVGWVAVGVTLRSIASDIPSRLPIVIAVSAALLAAGIAGAMFARQYMRRIAGDLPTSSIRDAVSSLESLRTLSAAMRAQSHEHGNRMHAAVGLLELGRPQEAIEILTETSDRQQSLLELVDTTGQLDPAVGALLLGKGSQAKERGVEWSVEIDPATPRGTLSAVDAVSVIGNLIDNALDAAGAGSEPRWVEVSFAPDARGHFVLTVADSGAGIPPQLADRIFEFGVSTKPAGTEGRGVGLSLVRDIVTAAGGTIEVEPSLPTTFTVTLPSSKEAP